MYKKIVFIEMMMFASCLFGNTWYADVDQGNDAWDGSEQKHIDGTNKGPKLTLQAAVEAAGYLDTVIAMPGVYKIGGKNDGSGNSRVCINKAITLKSLNGRETRDVTIIEGEPDTTDQKYGLGANAYRCVRASVANVVIEGFTLRGGRTGIGADSAASSGGGLFGNANAITNVKVVDCRFTDNGATRGGALRWAMAIRCIFDDNFVYNPNGGNSNGAVARDLHAYNCIFTRNGIRGAAKSSLEYIGTIVNCTFYANATAHVGGDGVYARSVYNSLFGQPIGTDGSFASNCNNLKLYNCVAYNSNPNATTSDCRFKVSAPQMVAPEFDDYRLVSSSYSDEAVCEFAGNAEYCSTGMTGEDWDTDYFGNPRVVNGKVDVGAVQGTVIPNGGRIYFPANSTVDGKKMPGTLNPCAYAMEWPKQSTIVVPDMDSNGNALFGLKNTSLDNAYNFPTRDNRFVVTYPPRERSVTYYVAYGPAVYADANTNDAEELQDGTSKHPYKSLQVAVNNVPSLGVVFAAEGDYSDTCNDFAYNGAYIRSRLQIDKHVFIRATGDRSKTFITGAADPETGTVGANAIRCVYVRRYNDNANTRYFGIQGFTLRNGHTNIYASDDPLVRGGGIMMHGNDNHYSVQVLDCTIKDCCGSRAAASWGCWLQRCLIEDNVTVSGGNATVRNAFVTASVFKGNSPNGGGVVSQRSYSYNCTFDEIRLINQSIASSLRNCLMVGTGLVNEQGDVEFALYGNIANPLASVPTSVRKDDPCVIGNGDYRLMANAAAVGGGDVAGVDYRFVGADYKGELMVFAADGSPTVGAFQHPVSCAIVARRDREGKQIVTTNLVEKALQVGDSAHPIDGVTVNGEFHATAFDGVYELPVPEIPSVSMIEVNYHSDFYVDASRPNDDGDGFTRETAKRTLAAACLIGPLWRGDRINVAEGVYNEGDMLSENPLDRYRSLPGDANPAIRARVVVPDYVAIVGAGMDKTIIEGRKDTTSGDAFGLGPNGMRGVCLGVGSSLEGVTVRYGRTKVADAKDRYDDFEGGAVLGNINSSPKSVARNCKFIDNAATRGGAIRYVDCYNCVFSGNIATVNCSAGRDASFYQCLFFRNVNVGAIGYFAHVENCTFYCPNLNNCAEGFATVATFCNNVVYVNTDGWRISALCGKYLNNVIFRGKKGTSGILVSPEATSVPEVSGNVYASLEDMKIDPETGRITGWDSPAVDLGLMQYKQGDTDLGGGQRVYNGNIDAGCYEFDWCARYKALLCGSRFISVTSASPMVRIDNDKVCIPDGEKLMMSFALDETVSFSFAAPTEVDGKFTAMQNKRVLEAGLDGRYLIAANDGDELEFSFVGENGYAELERIRCDLGMILIIR